MRSMHAELAGFVDPVELVQIGELSLSLPVVERAGDRFQWMAWCHAEGRCDRDGVLHDQFILYSSTCLRTDRPAPAMAFVTNRTGRNRSITEKLVVA